MIIGLAVFKSPTEEWKNPAWFLVVYWYSLYPGENDVEGRTSLQLSVCFVYRIGNPCWFSKHIWFSVIDIVPASLRYLVWNVKSIRWPCSRTRCYISWSSSLNGFCCTSIWFKALKLVDSYYLNMFSKTNIY